MQEAAHYHVHIVLVSKYGENVFTFWIIDASLNNSYSSNQTYTLFGI